MNHVYFNCQELQKFLERQWLKLRGIISQELSASQDARNSPILPLFKKSKNDVEGPNHTESNTREVLWNGSMDEIIEANTVTDVVSVIDTTCENLTSLLDAGYGYRKYYVLLLEALLKLLTTLKDVERQQPYGLRNSEIFGQLKVSVSITYALVEKVSSHLQLFIFFVKFHRLTCTKADPLPEKLRAQVAETKNLLNEILRSFELDEDDNNSLHITSSSTFVPDPVSAYGINKLMVVAHHHRALLLTGNKSTFFVKDSQVKVVYTVQTWLNNPNSLFSSAKRLSASVTCSSGKIFEIGVPWYPNKEVDPCNRTAFIVSGFEQAQVRSILPENDEPRSYRQPTKKAGALLQQDHTSSSRQICSNKQQKYAGELLMHSRPKSQQYKGEIIMSNMVLKLDCIGNINELRRLTLQGKKHKTKVWYQCCVEVTGEVLAIYRQRRRSQSRGTRDEGVFHTLGMGNHPELRDLIICSFVAMGLNSFL